MKTVLALSGGLDSTVLYYHLKALKHEVLPIAFDYGQRHKRELEAALQIATNVRVLTLPVLQLVKPDIPDGHYAAESMKATVSPNRNMIFLAIAASVAIYEGATHVSYAAHAGDHTIYPDCRPQFVQAMRHALHVGNWESIGIYAPFLEWTKADIVKAGQRLNVPFGGTWSCYRGQDVHCGTCGTCTERKEAFLLANIPDPTVYRS